MATVDAAVPAREQQFLLLPRPRPGGAGGAALRATAWR